MDDLQNYNLQDSEEVEFIIERDDEPSSDTSKPFVPVSNKRKWLRRLFLCLVAMLLLAAVYGGYKWWRYYHFGLPISTTPSENVDKLKSPLKKVTPEVVMTTDSIRGVALDFYAIHGLRANIEFEEPDTADTSVYLYCRSADHKADGSYLGSLVVNGEERQSDRSRLGYMGMADGHQVIGISRSEKVKRYVEGRGGSFFRQFILVSDGIIPSRFHLHKKVERRAIGRIGESETLYFIASRHKETMEDFADALRVYGFVDAIYITGGTDYVFYRTANGERHDIGDPTIYPHKKWKGIIPWLVFRK